MFNAVSAFKYATRSSTVSTVVPFAAPVYESPSSKVVVPAAVVIEIPSAAAPNSISVKVLFAIFTSQAQEIISFDQHQLLHQQLYLRQHIHMHSIQYN